MKRILLCLCLLAGIKSFAHDANIDGIYYNFNGDEACVTYYDPASSWIPVPPSDYSDSYSGAVVIPKSVTYNGKTYRVTRIEDKAFKKCSNLISITIPESVTYIENYAIYGCNKLTSLVVLDGNTTYDSRNNCNAIIETATNKLIAGCQTTIIPESVTSIGSAFIDYTSLTSITIPNSVTSIGSYAFQGCTGLTSITIPNSVTSIGGGAFKDCSGLTSITIPNGVTSIGNWAFLNCTSLDSVTIPSSVTSIDEGAFEGCTRLTSVTIPESVTSIGYYAFSDCRSLTSITIPNSVTTIGHGAFSGCSSLTSITIPNSVRTIEETAFYNCRKLASVTIGSGVTSISESAFKGCGNLASVTIGSAVTRIGDATFEGCNLRNVLIKCTTPPALGKYSSHPSFSDQTFNHAILYVPNGCEDAYAYNNEWGRFINIKETAMTEEPLSDQQAYTLMNAGTFTYSVYDNINDCVGSLSSEGIDENNPNHSWQMIKANRKHFLYNIGARKYLERSGDGFKLTSTPKSINVQNGDNGIILGAQASQQWALVSNDRMSVVQAAIEEVNNAGNTMDVVTSKAGCSTFYDSYYSYALPNGLSAQVVTNASDNRITYKTIAEGAAGGIVPKGTAVLLVSDNKSSGTFTLTAKASSTSYHGTNLLHGSDETTTTTGEGLHYKLSYGQTGTQLEKVFGWYWGAQDGAPFQIEGNKAWLVVPASAVTRASGGYIVDGDATDIMVIASEEEAGDVYYDIQGRRVSMPTSRGLYIKNGNKVVIK